MARTTDSLVVVDGPGRTPSNERRRDAVAHSLAVSGMTCGACASRIERALNRIEGVEAHVNYASERARILAPVDVGEAELLDAVRRAGYDADVLGADRVRNTAQRARSDAERVRTLQRRLIVAAILLMPLMDGSFAFSMDAHVRFVGWQWLLVTLSLPVVTWAAWPFHRAAFKQLRVGAATMDTLVSLGVIAATAWSVRAMFTSMSASTTPSLSTLFTHGDMGSIYFDVAGGVTTFLLAGRYFEARSRQRSGDALRALATLGAKEVHVLEGDEEVRRPISDVRVGDLFVVRPGEKVATDGIVRRGTTALDTHLMTGESVARQVGPTARVLGGMVSLSEAIVVEATAVGRDTQWGQMLDLVDAAQDDKATAQQIADRIASVFVPVVVGIAVLTLIGWLAHGDGWQIAVNASLSVLIIACPCALGLATPAALYVASEAGAKSGIFFKGYQALEASARIDTIIFDKTGTLTNGQMSLSAIVVRRPDMSADDLLGYAASLEQRANHPIARAIVADAKAKGIALLDASEIVSHAGEGVLGIVNGQRVALGRAGFGGRALSEATDAALRADGGPSSIAVIWIDDVESGYFLISDAVRPHATEAVASLRALGIRTIMVTGDNEDAARSVAHAVGIDEVVADALPAAKVDVLRSLQREGHRVAFAGDGVNDAPALASADLGLAVGGGTDIAAQAADLIVVRSDLEAVAKAVDLCRRTYRTIELNLVWAFAYNVVALPLAAAGLLNPLIAGGAMALSSAFVVANSARLRKERRSPTTSISRPRRRHRQSRGQHTHGSYLVKGH